MRPTCLSVATVLLATTLTAASPASAAPEATDRDAEATAGERHWYGWPLLITDTASLVLARLALEGSDNNVVLGLAGATYALAPAAMHAIHGNEVRALTSAGLRVGLPVLGMYLFDGISDCGPDSGLGCGYGDAYLGFLVGASAAIVIDHVMSVDRHAPARDPRHARSRRRPAALDVTPTLAVHQRGGALGLVGRF